MTPIARQAKITDMIRQKRRVTVNELSEAFNISKETIRRDLTALVRAGKVQKFHGGAFLPANLGEGPFRERMSENVIAKALIAARAAKLVAPGETVLVDTGSTTVYLAEKLAEIPHLTVITNSVEIARIMSHSPEAAQVFLLGGLYSADNRQTTGNLAISQISFFRAHHAILTVGALDAVTGVMDYSIEEAQIAQAMIEQAESLTVIVDSSKFGRIASFKVCGLDRITNVVCEKPPPPEIRTALENAKINIICVNMRRVSEERK